MDIYVGICVGITKTSPHTALIRAKYVKIHHIRGENPSHNINAAVTDCNILLYILTKKCFFNPSVNTGVFVQNNEKTIKLLQSCNNT